MKRSLGIVLSLGLSGLLLSANLYAKQPGSSTVSLSCSAISTASINETVPQGTAGPIRYIETVLMGSAPVDVSGWKLCTSDAGQSPYCVPYGTGNLIVGAFDESTQRYDSGITLHNPPEYLSSPQTLSSNEWEIALLDSSGKAIDYVHFCKSSCRSNYWTAPDTCKSDVSGGGSNKVIFARQPDGTGGFVPVTTPTPGSNNDGNQGSTDPDHFAISHSATGVTCQSEEITITAHDGSHQAMDAAGIRVDLSTSSGKGTWLGVVSGGESFSDPTAGDGRASFTFSSGASSAVLRFSYPTISGNSETFSFNVSDGSVSESAAEDPSMTFTRAGFRFIDGLGSEVLPTQIAGKASNVAPSASTIYLQAVQASDTDTSVCATALNGTQTVQLAAQCDNPASCVSGRLFTAQSSGHAAVDVALNDALPATPASYTNITMTFDAESKAPLVINYNDAGQMQLHARYTEPTTNALISGTSNPFVVRPFAFGFSQIEASGVANMAGDELSGEAFTVAGSDFELLINAYLYAAADDTDQDGIPDAGDIVTDNGVTPNFTGTPTLAIESYTPAVGVAGNLSGNTTPLLDNYANRSGADQALTLQYDETGSFSLQAALQDYLGASDADIPSEVKKIGRFYPDRFVLVSSAVEPALTGVTYMQQPFSLFAYELEARPQGGLDSDPLTRRVTQNYHDAYYSADIDTALPQLHAENADSGVDLGVRLTGYLDQWVDGVYRVSNSTALFKRQGTAVGLEGAEGLEDGPYSELQLSLTLDGDSDGAGFAADQMNTQFSGSGPCSSGSCDAVRLGDHSITGAEQTLVLRYGRVVLRSAHGPETADLAVPFAVEYWDGSRFTTHTVDSETQLQLSDIRFDGDSIDQIAERTVAVAAGSSTGQFATIDATSVQTVLGDMGLVFSAPGAGNTGYFPVGLMNVPTWLRYDWDQDGQANDSVLPDALITFGRMRGNDRMIFWQERYQQ